MPLFSNKFSPKKTPTRKAFVSLANKDLSPKRIEKELGPDVGPIRLRLGDQEAVFDGGQWIPGTYELVSLTEKNWEYYFPSFFFFNYFCSNTETGKAGGAHKENERLRREVKKLEEEINLLKLKFEVMLDMVIKKKTSHILFSIKR